MNIIIVGCGKVGKNIIANLSKENNDITVIDKNAEVIENVVNEYDVAGIAGNGANHEILLEAGVDKCDLTIAVTNSDEFNVICCLFAKKIGGCQTIARVRNPEYNKELSLIRDDLGLAMLINPEMAAAIEISRVLRFPSAISVDSFTKGRVELLSFLIPENSPLENFRVRDFRNNNEMDVLVCAVERDDEVYIPNGDFELKAKDYVAVVAPHKNIQPFFNKIDVKTNQVRSVIIAGGGEICFYLANILSKVGVHITIIEVNPQRCDELCEHFPKANIIRGDASEKTLLLEEGIENVDAFVALTNIDEENVMLTLYAKKVAPNIKTITKINKIEFDDIIKEMDLGTIVNPRGIASEYITSFVRAMKNTMGSNVETMYKIVNDKAEALEFNIREGSGVVGIPLMDIKLKSNILVACINRGGEVIYPRGRDSIQVGDSVVIITTRQGLNDIEDILA